MIGPILAARNYRKLGCYRVAIPSRDGQLLAPVVVWQPLPVYRLPGALA